MGNILGFTDHPIDYMNTTTKRHWFAYSLRTLFIAVTTLAIVIIWLGNTYRLVRERSDFTSHFKDFDYSLRGVGLLPPDDPPAETSWIRRLMGDYPHGPLMYSPSQDPDGSQLSHVRRLFPEAHIWGWEKSKDLPDGIKAIDQSRHIVFQTAKTFAGPFPDFRRRVLGY